MRTLEQALGLLADGESVVVGSAPDADVGTGLPGVEPRHARLVGRGGVACVQDLDSAGGTFVNGREVRGLVALRPGDRLRVGAAEVVVPHRQAQTGVGGGPLSLAVADATVRVGGGRVILDCVSLRVAPGEFVGLLGVSGSGKSTLVRAMAGLTRLSGGAVLLGGSPSTPERLRADRRVAYLPQDVVVHETLPVGVALDYVARLKGLGAGPADRRGLVEGVLARVGLVGREGVAVRRLSGGQRKRVALAAELLGDPRVVLLDEATSGLDPASEAEMMRLFRSLADEGRAVVCVTHSPGRLHLCDRLAHLMAGRLVFDGTPAELREFFGVESIEDVYARQADRPPEEWRADFKARFPGRDAAPIPAPISADPPPAPPPPARLARQALDLTGRYARLQWADARNLAMLLLQAPLIGLMVAGTFGDVRASFAELHAADTRQVVFVLVVAVLWCSGTAAVREVVKEDAVRRHEARFGVGPVPYLCSKFALLGLIALAQAAMLLMTVRHFTGLTGPPEVQFLVLGVTGLAGVALGLCVSATAGTSERAMTVLPVLLIGQAVFSGGLARLTGWAQAFARLCAPAWWALDGMRSTFSTDLANATYPGAPGHFQPPILGPGGPVLLDLAALIAQGAALAFLTWLALRRTAD